MVSDLALIPPEFRGLHPANPVNRPPAGGVQVELPPSARGTSPGSDSNPPLVVEALVAAVRAWEADPGLHGQDGLNGLNGQDGLDGQDGQDGLGGQDGLAGPGGLAGVDSFDGHRPGHQAAEHRSSRPAGGLQIQPRAASLRRHAFGRYNT